MREDGSLSGAAVRLGFLADSSSSLHAKKAEAGTELVSYVHLPKTCLGLYRLLILQALPLSYPFPQSPLAPTPAL